MEEALAQTTCSGKIATKHATYAHALLLTGKLKSTVVAMENVRHHVLRPHVLVLNADVTRGGLEINVKQLKVI